MTKRKSVASWVIPLITVGLLISIGYLGHCYLTQGIYFSIRNDTPNVLTNIRVTYTGGVVRIAELEPNASYGRHIDPSSESDLELAWFDSSGVEQFHKVDVYLEPNYRGNLAVTVEAHNRISWKDETAMNLF
jgi:hypothetical protein